MKISWQNYKGLTDGQIEASGREILSLPAEFGGKSAEMVITECKSEHKMERQQSQAPTETAEKLSSQIELKRAEQKCAERIASLNDEIASLEEKLLKVKSAQAKELASQERTLNEQLAELEGKQLRAEKYQHERLKGFEARINDWFEHVRFKMYERLSDGTLKETRRDTVDVGRRGKLHDEQLRRLTESEILLSGDGERLGDRNSGSEACGMRLDILASGSGEKIILLDSGLVEAIASVHDAAEPVNFILDDGTDRLLYATDTGTVPEVAGTFTKILIEANFSESVLIDSDLEEKLLSTLLLEEIGIFPTVTAILTAEDFYRPQHAMIFSALVKIYERGVPSDVSLVAEELKKRDELKKVELIYLHSLERLDAGKISGGTLDSSEMSRVFDASERLENLKLFWDDTGNLSVEEIRLRAKKLQCEHGLGLIVVDYLQLMRGEGNAKNNRVQEVSEISRGLKAMAKELEVPVLALSQLNRGVEVRAEKRPQLSDLRESGSIEQGADLVLFIYHEAYYERDSPEKNTAEITLAKNRHGTTGSVQMYFEPRLLTFCDLTKNQGGELC